MSNSGHHGGGTGCFRCFVSFTLTLGFTSLFMWLSLRTSHPVLSIQDVYIPSLNKTLNSTSYRSIYLDLKLDNQNKDKGIYYDRINITLQYHFNDSNSKIGIPISNYTLRGFYQGHNKKARRKNWTETYGMPWDAAVKVVAGGELAVFRVDLTTAIRFKILLWKTKKHRLVVGADFGVNGVGKKEQWKGTRLKSGAPELFSVTKTEMSNIAKLEFPALNISGENYMSWTSHVKRHLKSMDILETINVENNCSEAEKAKADVFLHKHIDEMLQFEYSNCDNPSALWNDLEERFNNQKKVLLPAAREEWANLKLQDFKRMNDYTSALFRICLTLRFCGENKTDEDMLEKTFSTFHASNVGLQTFLRLQGIKKYSELNSLLLVAEKNNEVLMRNHNARPTGSLAPPEANAIINDNTKSFDRKNERRIGRGRGHSHFDRNRSNHAFKRNNNYNVRGRGRGRGRGYSHRANNYHTTQNSNPNQQNKYKSEVGTSQNNGNSCFRCGSANHWSKACRTPPHLCELYQASLKGKEKEVNHVDNFDDDNTELNNSDFLPELEI